MWNMCDMDLHRAWFFQGESSRRGRAPGEERCAMVRQARKYSGFTLTSTSTSTSGGGGNEVVVEEGWGEGGGAETGGVKPGVLCMVHFQGSSKHLIPSFLQFLHEETDSFIFP